MDFQFSAQNEPPQIILGQVKHFSNLKWIFSTFSVINFCQFKIFCMKTLMFSKTLNQSVSELHAFCILFYFFVQCCLVSWSKITDSYIRLLTVFLGEYIVCLRSFSLLCTWQKFSLVAAFFSFFQLGFRSERSFFLYFLTAHRPALQLV